MTLQIIGRQIDIGDALRGQIEEKLEAAVLKYFDGGYKGHVTLSKQGGSFRSECIIHLDSGHMLEAQGIAGDGYSAFGEAVEHLEKRLRRYKRRLKDHKSKPSFSEGLMMVEKTIQTPAEYHDDAQEENFDLDEFTPIIIAESTQSLSNMRVSDAVLEMDMTGVTALPFRNEANGHMNIVYRRKDGHIGWIDLAG